MSDYIVVLFKKLSSIVLGLVSSIVVARYLGVEMRGEYAYILAVSAISVVFLNFGVNAAYQNQRLKHGAGALKPFVIYSTGLAISMLALSIVLYISSEEKLVVVIVAIASISLFRMQLGHYNLVESIKYSSYISIAAAFFEAMALVFVYVLSDKNLYYVVGVYMLKELLAGVASLVYLSRRSENSEGIKFKAVINRVFSGGGKMYAITILIVLNYKIDIAMLGFFGVDSELIGIFAVGVLISEYIWLIPDIFKDVQTKRTAQGGGHDDVAFSTRISSFVVCVLFLIFILIGKYLITLAYGSEYSESYNVALWMFLASYAMIFVKIFGTLYISRGYVDFYFRVMLISTFLNIALNSILIPSYSTHGAIISSLSSYGIAGMLFVRDFCSKYNYRSRDVLLPTGSDCRAIKSKFVAKFGGNS